MRRNLRNLFSSGLLSLLLLFVVLLSGCNEADTAGPPSTNEDSSTQATLKDKVDFLEQYVVFEREYAALEYDIAYVNNGGWVPGPSDWDVRLLAVVPNSEIADWIPKDVTAEEKLPPVWVDAIPGDISTDGITEWYVELNRVVGVDRERFIVAYRSSSMTIESGL